MIVHDGFDSYLNSAQLFTSNLKVISISKSAMCPEKPLRLLTLVFLHPFPDCMVAIIRQPAAVMGRGRPKENFCHSAKSRKRAPQKSLFLQKYRKNRKKLFLPKEPPSAERDSFCRKILPLLLDYFQILSDKNNFFLD